MNKKLKDFLDQHHVKYIKITHSPAYTAQDIAEVSHVSGMEIAKAVMVNKDGQLIMCVLPGSYIIDFNRLKDVTGADDVRLASEEEFQFMFPDSEPGAMPPFGNLYGVNVFLDSILSENNEIVFNCGNYSESIRMDYDLYRELVKPEFVSFSMNPGTMSKKERPVESNV